jgi:hypothetical protein
MKKVEVTDETHAFFKEWKKLLMTIKLKVLHKSSQANA